MRLIERVHEGRVARRRARVLSEQLAEILPPGTSVLDVGCGDGQIAWLVQQRRSDIRIQGLDVLQRQGTWIPVQRFDGRTLPCEDRAFDVVMFVDVLHHTRDPRMLLQEAVRVAREAVTIKDHVLQGLFAERTLRFMDRVGNRRHGVALPYNYWRRRQWHEAFSALGMEVEVWKASLKLYWWPLTILFDRSLHFLARLAVRREGSPPAGVESAGSPSERSALPARRGWHGI